MYKPHYIALALIYIYFFNIKYIINSLITQFFPKKKFNDPNKC